MIDRNARPLFLVLALTGMVLAEDRSDRESETARRERNSRMEIMRRRVLALKVEVEAANNQVPSEIVDPPLLRYSNPASPIVTPDATVWAWGRKGRPAALASVEEAGCEIVSLIDERVSLVDRSGRTWSSAASEISWKAVPDAPPPAETAAQRTRQMKDISQQFSAMGHYVQGSDNHEQLRLLERHLHRYADPEQGLIDGAIFAFVAGTNPEVILLVECRVTEGNRRAWFYGFTRLSAGALEARRGDRVIWACPAIVHWSEKAPYYSFGFGKDDFTARDK